MAESAETRSGADELFTALTDSLNGAARDTQRVLIVLGLVAFAIYLNALNNPFVLDDNFLIVGDARVQKQDFAALLTTQYWPSAGNDLYRPVTSVSFALNWAVAPQSWAFRLVNLLLYIACAFVLYRLIAEWSRSHLAALIAAVLWVVHPIHTYSLNSVIDRAEILACGFGLLTLLLAVRDLRAPEMSISRLALMGLAFAMAVFSKESALTVVGVAVAVEIFERLRRKPENAAVVRSGSRLLLRFAVLIVVAGGYIAARQAVVGNVTLRSANIGLVQNPLVDLPHVLAADQSATLARIATPIAVFGKAIALLIVPTPLSWDYSYNAIPVVTSLLDLRLWIGVAALIGLIGGAIWAWRARHPSFCAIALLLIGWTIVSNTVVLIGTLFGERFLFSPSAGWCALVAFMIVGCLDWARRRSTAGGGAAGVAVLAFAALLLATYGVVTIDRNRDFRDETTLHAADVMKYPNSCRLLTAIAQLSLARGEWKQAEEWAARALRISDELPLSWRTLGLAQYQQDRIDDAEISLREAIKRGEQGEQTVLAAADIEHRTGDDATAIRVVTAFLEHNPSSVSAMNSLAWYLAKGTPESVRDVDRAIKLSSKAIAAYPREGSFLDTHIVALRTAGRTAEARSTLERCLPKIATNDPAQPALKQHLAELQAQR